MGDELFRKIKNMDQAIREKNMNFTGIFILTNLKAASNSFFSHASDSSSGKLWILVLLFIKTVNASCTFLESLFPWAQDTLFKK